MSIQHHSQGEIEAHRRLVEEFLGEAVRKHPHGSIAKDDEGETAMAITADLRNKIVRIQFTKPIEWIGLDVESTRALAKMLTEKADALAILESAPQGLF